jgi:Leucine-rich repeat (LRR) protein
MEPQYQQRVSVLARHADPLPPSPARLPDDVVPPKGSVLPPNLEVLHALANDITDLRSLSASHPASLVHIGLGYNLLTVLDSTQLPAASWTNLISLDVSYNQIADMDAMTKTLEVTISHRDYW